jgi:hypothetical protein
MSDRDELAAITYLSGYDPEGDSPFPIQPLTERPKWQIESHYRAADAILAAGYRKPRTIKSASELEALPFGSAVQTSDESDVIVLRCEGRDFRNQSGYELSVETLWRYGTRPFFVLWEPLP